MTERSRRTEVEHRQPTYRSLRAPYPPAPRFETPRTTDELGLTYRSSLEARLSDSVRRAFLMVQERAIRVCRHLDHFQKRDFHKSVENVAASA
jgi:hypothetical protein